MKLPTDKCPNYKQPEWIYFCPIISAVSWKINWILDYFWIPYLLINQQHYPLYRTKSYLFMYFQRNTRTNLPPFSVKMQVYFKTASHNPHSIPVKLQQHITSALFDGMDRRFWLEGKLFCRVRRKTPRGCFLKAWWRRITLCVICYDVAAHKRQGYLWSPISQDMLYAQPAGSVSHALWVFLPCFPQEASMVQSNGSWFSWEQTPETRFLFLSNDQA